MYRFLQFDPNKKESWKLYAESQLADLPQKPAFLTVLAVDKDPESLVEQGEDPLDHVKYYGPMYFDLDGSDLEPVLHDARGVLQHLHKKFDIPKDLISCWLSGVKGVHITVPAQVFGVKTPTKYLPYIYGEMANAFPQESLDRGVYSAGRGRMWRCEGIKRPGVGTFKVPVTFDELMDLSVEDYQRLVSAPRPPAQQPVVGKTLVFPKAESAFKAAKPIALKRVKAMKGSVTIPKETLRSLEETPGCVLKLITEGDSAESNWNQAAMQLASYIAARYEREESDEYTDELVDPFVINVESSSRPSEKERRKHVQDQLNRAFSGRTKFSPGALISVIGRPCGDCVVCQGDKTDASLPGAAQSGHDHRFPLNPRYVSETYRVIRADNGYFMLNGENSYRRLGNFTFDLKAQVVEVVSDDKGIVSDGDELGLIVDISSTESRRVARDVFISTDAFFNRRTLYTAISGKASSALSLGDADVQILYAAIIEEANGKSDMDTIKRSPQCGIIMERTPHGLKPHYVEACGSYTRHGIPSPYRYTADKDTAPTPTLLESPGPLDDGDMLLTSTLVHLSKINEPHWVAAMVGWFAACHYAEHLFMSYTQFPLLNISGNAGAGKTQTAFLMAHLNGMDYGRDAFINAEVATPHPLNEYLTSSTTVPRLVEEVNPSLLSPRMATQVLGTFKAAWNRAAVQRGTLHKNEVRTKISRVSSPIVYTSEQTSTVPSLRNRSIEVKLSSKALENREHKLAFGFAKKNRASLHRLAKAMVADAMDRSPQEVAAEVETFDVHVPEKIGERPHYSWKVVLFGLNRLIAVMKKYDVGAVPEYEALKDSLIDYLSRAAGDMAREKAVSEVDKVLASLDCMADEIGDRAAELRAGDHYWRNGDDLYLVLQACLPRYARYARQMGEAVVIRDPRQMATLLEGQPYFDRIEDHPGRPGVRVHVINLARLADRAFTPSNFKDNTEPNGV